MKAGVETRLMNNHEEAADLARRAIAVLDQIPEEWQLLPQLLHTRAVAKYILGQSQVPHAVDFQTWMMLVSASDDMATYLRLTGGFVEEVDRLFQTGLESSVVLCGVQLLDMPSGQPPLDEMKVEFVRQRSTESLDNCERLDQLVLPDARNPGFAKEMGDMRKTLDKFKSK